MDRAYDLMTKLFQVSESEFYVRLDDVIEAQIRDLEVIKERMVKSQVDYSQTLVQLEKTVQELRKFKELSWQEWESQKQY